MQNCNSYSFLEYCTGGSKTKMQSQTFLGLHHISKRQDIQQQSSD